MKTLTLVVMALALTSAVSLAAEPSHQYVGVKVCAMCHRTPKSGEQFQKWEASKHSQAYKTLLTPEAKKIAEAKGIKGSPADSPECLQCHVTAYDAPASQLGPRFSKEDGVQCETCHGPGKDYMKMDIMKNEKEAVAHGLTLLSVKDGSAEKFCETCHNKKSPTFKGFDFKTMWAKIAHPVPQQ